MPIFKYYPSDNSNIDKKLDKKIIRLSFIQTLFLIAILWMIKIAELTLNVSFYRLGLYPLHVKGLKGIIFSPLLHADFGHLISNSAPLFVLLIALFYYYRRISYPIFGWLYLLSGLFLWFFGRQTWHIGASGLVYALAAFHLVSGIIRNDVRLLMVSLIVVFLYGGFVWGMMPINPNISWDGHLWGAIAGILIAFAYRKYYLYREKYEWEEEDEEDDEWEEENNENTENTNTNYSSTFHSGFDK